MSYWQFFTRLFLNRVAFTLILSICASNSVASCDSTDIQKIRDYALSLYQKGKIKPAQKLLQNYYQQECSFYDMSKSSDTVLNQGLWLISDLMLYHYKSDDYLSCLNLVDQVYSSFMLSNPERHQSKVETALQKNISHCKSALAKAYSKPETCPISGHEGMYAIPDSWASQNALFYEQACIKLVENSASQFAYDRDGKKYQSEGMSSYLKLEVLFVDTVTQSANAETSQQWQKNYQTDFLYLANQDGLPWADNYCYSFDLRLGQQPGMLLLDGSSSPCHGGSALQLNRAVIKLEYPFRAQVLEHSRHSYK